MTMLDGDYRLLPLKNQRRKKPVLTVCGTGSEEEDAEEYTFPLTLRQPKTGTHVLNGGT